jgi:hypothetical protein
MHQLALPIREYLYFLTHVPVNVLGRMNDLHRSKPAKE